jgi:DNA-binding transcriptional ArsR family regulator
MSIQAVAAAVEVQGLAPATKLVLMLLANRHNGDTGLCYPKQETLAAEAGMSVRSLRTHIIELEKAGMICRAVFRLGNGQADQTHYTFPFLDRQNLPPKDLDRQKSTFRPANSGELDRQLIAAPIEDKPEENRKEPEDTSPPTESKDIAKLALETIWAKWSKTGKERCQTNKSKILELLRKIGKTHDLRDVTRAALRYAKATDPAFHQGLDTWLKNGRFQNFIPSKAPETAPQSATSELERAFSSFAETGEWTGDRLGFPIPPHHPSADYPLELYARFDIARPAERNAA